MNLLIYISLFSRFGENPLHLHYFKGKTVLDVGCGEGDFLAKDKSIRVGIDIDPKMVAKCKERHLVAHCMSASDLVFLNGTFDAVHASELIEHLHPQEAVRFLLEASRVLKPDGIIYLTTPGERNVWNTFSHIKPYPPMAFEKLLNKSTEGFLSESYLPLRLERSFAFSAISRFKWLTRLKRTLNIAFPARRPTGYVIILKKFEALPAISK